MQLRSFSCIGGGLDWDESDEWWSVSIVLLVELIERERDDIVCWKSLLMNRLKYHFDSNDCEWLAINQSINQSIFSPVDSNLHWLHSRVTLESCWSERVPFDSIRSNVGIIPSWTNHDSYLTLLQSVNQSFVCLFVHFNRLHLLSCHYSSSILLRWLDCSIWWSVGILLIEIVLPLAVAVAVASLSRIIASLVVLASGTVVYVALSWLHLTWLHLTWLDLTWLTFRILEQTGRRSWLLKLTWLVE